MKHCCTNLLSLRVNYWEQIDGKQFAQLEPGFAEDEVLAAFIFHNPQYVANLIPFRGVLFFLASYFFTAPWNKSQVAACPLLQKVWLNADDCEFQISPIDEGILALGQQLVLDVNQQFNVSDVRDADGMTETSDQRFFQTCCPLRKQHCPKVNYLELGNVL